ncbi:hypothetical protein CHS0354_019429, partial [Potamilus streckersoni]
KPESARGLEAPGGILSYRKHFICQFPIPSQSHYHSKTRFVMNCPRYTKEK